jgi:hypothetical protein
LIAPSVDEVKPVVAWLKSHGVEKIDVSGRDFIKAKAPIRIIEKLFQTEMHNFRLPKQVSSLACNEIFI